MPSTHPPITLRPPTTSTHLPQQQPSFTAPTPQWLSGTWHVTHSTLPMWKSKRNVSITYTPLTEPSPSPTTKLDDLVQYQTLTSAKMKTVEGIDTPSSLGAEGGEWDWRGKGWLRVASSHWEVLGWGNLPDYMGGEGEGEGEGGNQWVVTFFAKTLFTPAGIDVYSRRKEGVGREVVEGIQEALGGSADEGVRRLAREVFEVVRD
ncbi:MAG: hypothetical protein L6R36_007571 [Xanthoria steineri]|nr:MAG: hypothetical protein L6R36_007571 [Xanthoria steineri]